MLWFLTRLGWANTAVIFALALTPAVAFTSRALGPETGRTGAGPSAQVEDKTALMAAFDAGTQALPD